MNNPSINTENFESDALSAFMDFVECGRSLPEMTTAQLHRVVDDGLDYS